MNAVITQYDDNNKTVEPLGAGETWTGRWSPIPPDNNIKINALTDQFGSLFIDYCNEVDISLTFTEPPLGYSLGNAVPETLIISPTARFYRLRFVNSDVAQSYLEIYPYFTRASLPRLTPLNKRAGRDENSIYTRASDPQEDILRSLRAGVQHLNKWGFRDDIDIADGDALIIADDTTNTPTIISTATTFTIAYNNAVDGDGTTGALSLLFTYLDENEDLQTAIHVLGSTGNDVTSFSGLGINRCIILSSGSMDFNAGNINITATTGGSVQAYIPAMTSTTQQVLAFVPRNTIATLRYLDLNAFKISGGSAPRVVFKLLVYSRTTNTTYEILRERIDTDVENNLQLVDPIGLPLSPRDVFWVSASTTVNSTQVSARMSLNYYEID